jgi:hypothetical protein
MSLISHDKRISNEVLQSFGELALAIGLGEGGIRRVVIQIRGLQRGVFGGPNDRRWKRVEGEEVGDLLCDRVLKEPNNRMKSSISSQ